MSNKKNSKKDKNIEPVLNQCQIAQKIQVILPQKLKIANINILLMQQYLLNKLLNKKVKSGMKFTAIYLGLQENFQILRIVNHNHNQNQKLKQVQKISQIQIQKKKQEQEEKQFFYVVKEQTKLELLQHQSEKLSKFIENGKKSQYSQNFFGCKIQLQDLKQTVFKTLFEREQLLSNGLGPLKGILVSGFSGTGKSTLIRKLSQIIKQESKQQIFFKIISSVHLLSKVVGGAEQYIRTIFSELKQKQPSILVIQDMHLLFSKKDISANSTTLAALVTQLDNLYHEKIIVIGSYNSEKQLANQIRSSGKFQKQIVLNLPNHHQRLQILQGFVNNIKENQQKVSLQDLKRINLRLNGFSIGQIKQILRESFIKSQSKITKVGLEQTLKSFKPSEIKQLIVQVPQVYWKDIGGYQEVKKQIKKVTQLPLKSPQIFKKFGIQPIKGIMLYGPPGCSKTMMAKAIATESKLNFIGVKGPELFSKYVGDSQRAIRNIFKRARACSPCIIFFDQIDALATQRSSNTQVSDRVLCQLLNEMDGIQGLKQVVIVAATNRPQILDKALMRPGRFDYLIYISPPDLQARTQIFKIYLEKSKHKPQDIQNLSKKLAQKTSEYTGAEISLVCREAALIALQQNLECEQVQEKHFLSSLQKIKKRLTKDMILKYQSFNTNLKY